MLFYPKTRQQCSFANISATLFSGQMSSLLVARKPPMWLMDGFWSILLAVGGDSADTRESCTAAVHHIKHVKCAGGQQTKYQKTQKVPKTSSLNKGGMQEALAAILDLLHLDLLKMTVNQNRKFWLQIFAPNNQSVRK